MFEVDVSTVDRLVKTMQEYAGNVEKEINDVLHNEAGQLIEDSIRPLIPVSGKSWKGKKPPARTSKSMTQESGNLSVTVKSTKNYGYLYFPDDGTNTRRHVGNQQFFARGAELVTDNIIDRCIDRLITDFEEGV